MKKIISLVLLLLFSSIVSADKAVIGYYQNGAPYYDYVIVYTYTRADGTIGLSHCRTRNNANLQYAFLSQSMLNINDCDLSYTPPASGAAPGQENLITNPTVTGFSSQAAF